MNTVKQIKQKETRLLKVNERLSEQISEETYRELLKTKNELIADVQTLKIQLQKEEEEFAQMNVGELEILKYQKQEELSKLSVNPEDYASLELASEAYALERDNLQYYGAVISRIHAEKLSKLSQ